MLSAVAFALIAVGGLSTGRGWWGIPVVPVVLLAAAALLTEVRGGRGEQPSERHVDAALAVGR